MFDKIQDLEIRFQELESLLSDPAIIANQPEFRKLSREHADLAPLIETFRRYKKVLEELDENQLLLADPEMKEMAEEELARLGEEKERLDAELKILLLPKDPNDERDVVLEIRAGAGGDEASLFAAEMFRMYARYAEQKRWRVELTSCTESSAGGFKEVIALVSGDKVYSRMKYESGVHRVQRVPVTEQQGRIHTSTVTVAVLPEADEVEVKIDPKDLRIDTFCSSGPGGQSVNTTYSAVRMTHLPTGLVVSCQDEKSQIKNRAKAERVLRSRLYEMELEKQRSQIGAERRSMVGTGDRSEKIRTYNFKENRVTDHRIGLTIHQLDQVMEGDLDPVVDALTTYYQAEKLKQQSHAPGVNGNDHPNGPRTGQRAS